MKLKHNPEPWDFLDKYRNTEFEGQWPSLAKMFDISVKRYPENKCFECFTPKHIQFNYVEAQKWMDTIARYLVSLGVGKGDRVGLTGKNSPEWALAYMGITRMGAIVVPVDYSLTDEEIEHFFDFVEIKGLFVEGERFDRIGKDGKYLFKISLSENEEDNSSYILNIPVTDSVYTEPNGSDSAAFLFTSGTTGTPKVVELTNENLVADCYMAQGKMNIYSTDVFYAILPIHHAYTMLAVFIESMSVGANLVFGKKLIVNQIFKEMKEAKVTMFLAVPMLYNKIFSGIMKGVESKGKFVSKIIKMMMSVSGFFRKRGINIGKKMFKFLLEKVSLDSNRICISGGGPLPPQTSEGFNKLGIDFVQGYGLTETSPILTLDPIFDYEPKSIGQPLPFVQIKFEDKDDQGNGEICVKGPMLMKGYYKNPEATSAIIDTDGWLHTGDIGYQDERGFVYLTGRAKNIIVSEGGKNIFPEEIEDHFQLYYDIEQICVLGYVIDSEKKTEGVAAIVYPSKECRKAITDPSEMQKHMEEIVETVNKELLPYKRIRKVIVTYEEMEQSSTKKIKRFIVSKKFADALSNCM